MNNFRLTIRIFLAAVILAGVARAFPAGAGPVYAVVVSAATAQDRDWAAVVGALQAKHQAAVITVTNVFGPECRAELRRRQPEYVAFVAKPAELGPEFVRQVHLLSRTMDEDPYDDFLWGIITGATPEAALRLARVDRPLVVRRALTTTGIKTGPLDACLTLSDGRAGDFLLKNAAGEIHGTKTNDTLSAHERFLEYYNTNDVDLLVTSSHATEANLEMPFSDGSIVTGGGRMFMVDKAGMHAFVRATRDPAASGSWCLAPGGAARRAAWAQATTAPELRRTENPKVYLAAGNCLIGDAMNSADSLVMDWLTGQGVDQFVGYTVETWYGAGGWGTLELWQDYGGQNDLAEAFFLNNQRIIHKLVTKFPAAAGLAPDQATLARLLDNDGSAAPPGMAQLLAVLAKVPAAERNELLGCLYDRDVVAFYGDPAWEARLDPARAESPVRWHWSGGPTERVLELTCLTDFKKDELIIRPPERMKHPRVTASAGLDVQANGKFVWINHPDLTAGKTCRLVIAADPL